jgi:hypothetical protein
MVIGVALALLSASPTCLGAGLHDRPGKLRHELRLPAENSASRDANVAAVLARPDAANHHADIVLTEASIRTSGTALCAVEARVDAGEQSARLNGNRPRMRLQHVLGVSHNPPFLGRDDPYLIPRLSQAEPARGGGTTTRTPFSRVEHPLSASLDVRGAGDTEEESANLGLAPRRRCCPCRHDSVACSQPKRRSDDWLSHAEQGRITRKSACK